MNVPVIDSDGGHVALSGHSDPRISPVASLAPDVSPVASLAPDVSPVASLAPDVSPVASLAPDVSPVASLAPDVSPVASLAPDVSPVASLAPDVSPVASLAPDVSPVASLAPDVRLRLDVAYDGTDFAGWAAQTDQRTVAGAIDDALSTMFRTPIVTTAAGRTDTGVHATGQVAHADVPADAISLAYPRNRHVVEPEFLPLVRRLGRFLPEDVRVLDVVRAPVGFDARFSALRRHYEYRLSTASFGVEPQLARFVTPWPRPLDVDAMTVASRNLLGLNDFAAFCKHRDGATTIRDLQRLDWSRDGDLITVAVTADAFCWSMVRSLVGALIAVGEGRREPGWCAELVTATRRSSDFTVAPARGLTLVGVDYPPDDQLEARVEITREVRSIDEVGRS